jgi:hypothetical protein
MVSSVRFRRPEKVASSLLLCAERRQRDAGWRFEHLEVGEGACSAGLADHPTLTPSATLHVLWLLSSVVRRVVGPMG